MPAFRPVPILDVITETADARSFVLGEPFAYRPGQYLTVRTPAGVRCYSLSSAPGIDPAPVITVKRVRGGAVSNWLCDHVRAGDALEMAGPAGTFTPSPSDGDLLMLAGGSGITPIMGIIKAEQNRRILLVYANRDADSVIFGRTLSEMAGHGRLAVEHWLDSERGVPGADALAARLTAYTRREALVCGPEAFVAVAEKALQLAGVVRVRVEHYDISEMPDGAGGMDSVAEVEIDGRTHTLPWASGRRLLDVIVDAGLNPPYSCRQGQCGACACRLISGEVDLVNNEVLEDEDFAEGYILACQAVARTPQVKVTYY
ncbi:ferredoxin--NADP reductase [Actinoplanes sp. NPDC051851]|uniref:ferredoxin--NADP reductase n=1 Tax=Actinoplanes sp. NPDC051851 TaxID=3154753 RepID=UPI0034352CDD